MKFGVKIVGAGVYVPKRVVSAEEVDEIAGLAKGTVRKKVGVIHRRYVDDESVSFMAKNAILSALDNAKLDISDLDLICYAGASAEQFIPTTSALIQRQLGLSESGIACFDINSTCLSFVTALDHLSILVDSGRYKKVALVSSEIPSKCVNYKHIESAGLFGDGAAAVILAKDDTKQSEIHTGLHRTYSIGADLCRIEYGGSKYPPNDQNYREDTKDKFLFEMEGTLLFKMSYELLPKFVDDLLAAADLNPKEIKYIVPHQASPAGMRIISKKLGFDGDRFVNIVEEYGNMIAASIPFGLCKLIHEGKLNRGDMVVLLGTSAGVSLGGVVLKY